MFYGNEWFRQPLALLLSFLDVVYHGAEGFQVEVNGQAVGMDDSFVSMLVIFGTHKVVAIAVGSLAQSQQDQGVGRLVLRIALTGMGYTGTVFFQHRSQRTDTVVAFVSCAIFANSGIAVVGSCHSTCRPVVEVSASRSHVEVDGTKATLQGIEQNVLRLHGSHAVEILAESSANVTIPSTL